MKITKTSSGTFKVVLTSQDWLSIGKQNGWLSTAQQSQKIADEIVERQPGEPVEQAINAFMQYAGDDMVTHEEDGIGNYEVWGHQMHDSGSVNSFIDKTLAVDVTDLQNGNEEVPHSLSGRVLGGQVQWHATLQGQKPINGKVFAIYQVQ